jgi:hypothetical protein
VSGDKGRWRSLPEVIVFMVNRENIIVERYQVDLEVVGTENQKAIIQTGWIVQPETDFARLVTLYVKKQP